ncbi:DUF3667 domain-containing protein [Sphingomonas sanguinis]|uniref:DUF3667 domain-containing protein n=1 Tax=Sphingomonas sanguinis TaxID=33051 RepID=A0A147JA03_9SPHN|nr:DUF3667 domain-containing protein [Sphingomonas sanguinis]KTW14736.1 hypothetical protein NS258_06480 [Sphingomonas sanguinis]
MHAQARNHCLNCGTALVGDYCHACGQSTHIHRTLGAWWHDFSHGVLHIEGQVWRTMAMLVTRPGELTRRYIAGERRRFLSPLALYLFSVFLLYVAYSVLGGFATFHAPDTKQAVAQIHTKAEKTEQRIAAIDRKRVEDLAARRDVAALDRERAQLVDRRQELEMASMALGGGATSAEAHGGGHETQVITGWKTLDEKIDHAIRDPDFLIFKMEANGYKFSWALILLSMPFMGLIFLWKRGVAMFDHAVFVTYSLSFVSLLMVVMILWVKLAHLPGEALWLLAFPAHLFLQLRGAYGLGPLLGLLMTLVVTVMAGAVLLIWIIGLLALGMAH